MIHSALNCRQLQTAGNDVQQAADFLSPTVTDYQLLPIGYGFT